MTVRAAYRDEPRPRRSGGGGPCSDARSRRQRSPPNGRPAAAERDPTAAPEPADRRSECYSVDMKGGDVVFTYTCSYIS